MRPIPRALLISALICGFRFAACSDDFAVQSQVIGLRVLGVQAEPAELILQDGGSLPSTTLTALAIEPSGALITTAFSLCQQQGILPAANLDCPGDAGYQLPDAGPLSARLDLGDPHVQAIAISLELSFDGGIDDAGNSATGIEQLLMQGIPIVLGFSADAPAYGNPDGGPAPTPGYIDQHLIGFTDITLREASPGWPVNQNPTLAGITANDVMLAADGSTVLQAGVQVELVPVPASDAKEPLPDGGVESLDYSFYTTTGDLADLRSTDTTSTGQPGIISVDYTPQISTVPARLWVVVRDGRGGIGWLERDFVVSP